MGCTTYFVGADAGWNYFDLICLAIENNLNVEVDWDLLSEPEQQRGRFLYSLLGSLVQGRLMGLIRNVEQFNGYEALRQLLSNCQPNARNRTLSLLQGIMAYPSFNMRTSLLPQILKLEEHYYQYEKLGGKLSPDMKAAILLRSVGGQMKVHLNLALNEGSTYAQIREAIIAFDNATTKWNEAGHMSKDCWRVRQVEAPTTQSLSSTSQQGSTPSTTMTSTTSGGDVSQKTIRRVSQPAVFDLRETSLTGSIRMVQESPRSSVEYYSIATDDEAEDEEDHGYTINTIQQYDSMEIENEVPKDEEKVNVILDSGADASLFPGRLMDKGIPTSGACPYLQDAQGTKIKTYGHSDVDIVMHAKDGREVIIKERVTFSDLVSQPILSYGRLLRTGWSIDGGTQCLKHDETEVPLAFQNQSLVVRAAIRMIHEPGMIRTLRVKLGQELQEAALGQYGWKKKEHFWMGLHSSRHYQTPQTTKIYDSAGNGLVENAIQRIRSLAATLMENLTEQIELRFQSQHPIWSWACRHSAWLINRFQPFHGSTSFELAHGRAYEGKLCNFGEVCFAYCKPKQGYKADPKWRLGIYLGKTELQDNWVIGDANKVYLSRCLRRMSGASKKNLMCYKGFTAYSWEYQQNFGGRIVPSKRMASMVGVPMSRALPPSSGVSPDDVDAQEVLAFVKSYAGKREEARELVEDEPNRVEGREGGEQKSLAELQLAEDKKQDFVEEEVPELVKVSNPMVIDERRNQAGPSAPRPKPQQLVSTPRSTASKTGMVEQEKTDMKKMKMTVEKAARPLEASSPEPKRPRHEGDGNMERRVEVTQVGTESYYHMDDIIGEEEMAVWSQENEEEEEQALEIPDALWSDAPLDRVPPDPPKWVDDLADEVEEKRLERLGVLAPVEKRLEGYKSLTTRFVRDWRAKPRTKHPGAPKQFLRRSRLVAREYATDRRDDVHSPATGGQALRLLPSIYLMKKAEEEHGGLEYTLGALDIKDAFLQVPQAVPTQVSTASGHFEVKKNLPGQRIGAKAWFEYLTDWLKAREFSFSEISPCLGRLGHKMMLLIHVDDVMFVGEKDYVMEQFIPDLKQSFEISEQHLTGEGSSFQFLRRTYVEIEGGLKVMPGKYAESMIEMYEEKLGKAKIQKLPCGPEVLEADGKLRHIAGKLLWIQDLVAQEELRVKAVGTLHNVADLGTKPLSRNRIMLILYWCNTRSGDGEKLGEEEYAKMEESRVNRVKIQKLAKLLNRILLVGGLEQATASRAEGLEEKVERNNGLMMMVVVAMALMILALTWAVYKLWGIVEELKIKIADAKDSAYVNGVSTRAYVQGMREEMKEMKSYSQKIHRGLIKASGYIDKEEVNEEEWRHWNYIQDSNKDFDLRRIHAQIKAYKEENERDNGPIDLRPYRNMEEAEMQEENEEETVTVRLDSGEVVQIPLRFIEAREPESEDEAPETAMEVSEATQQVEWADEDLPTQELVVCWFAVLPGSVQDGIMLIKVLRLGRVCRLIRVMRFGAVRELRVIILGVLSGVRVLFWAIALLFFTVFLMGVSLRILFDSKERTKMQQPSNLKHACPVLALSAGLTGQTPTLGRGIFPRFYLRWQCYFTLGDPCARKGMDSVGAKTGVAELKQSQEPEFTDVPSAMFTAFRCVTDGCSDYLGAPLHERLRRVYGDVVIPIYMVLFLFVVIGIFNLIMAVFLDSVLNDHEARELQELGYKSAEMEQHISQVIATLVRGDRVKTEPEKPKSLWRWIGSFSGRTASLGF
eukprot:g30204.t1